MSFEPDEDIEEDTYNLEALWLKKLLSIWTDLNVPARLVALRTPNEDTVLEWARVLDSVMSILELSNRMKTEEIQTLYKSYNKCIGDCLFRGEWSATPLRKFEGQIARIMAKKRFFTMGSDYVDKVEGPEE
jgi:hypothetical protein